MLTLARDTDLESTKEIENAMLDREYLKKNIYQISHEDTEENHVCCKSYNDRTEDTANKNDSNNLSSHCGKYSSNEEVLEKTVNNEKKKWNIVVNDEGKKEMNNTKRGRGRPKKVKLNGNKKNEEDLINCNDKEIEKNCNKELKSFSENSKQAQKKENLEVIKLKNELKR